MPVTARQVRIRGALILIGTVLTLALILLAFAVAGSAEWLVLLILFIEFPVYVLLGIVEWIERRHA